MLIQLPSYHSLKDETRGMCVEEYISVLKRGKKSSQFYISH